MTLIFAPSKRKEHQQPEELPKPSAGLAIAHERLNLQLSAAGCSGGVNSLCVREHAAASCTTQGLEAHLDTGARSQAFQASLFAPVTKAYCFNLATVPPSQVTLFAAYIIGHSCGHYATGQPMSGLHKVEVLMYR